MTDAERILEIAEHLEKDYVVEDGPFGEDGPCWEDAAVLREIAERMR